MTRPAAQADGLVRRVEAAGGRATRFPTIEIAPPADPRSAALALRRLHEFSLAIFTSPNAVRCALASIASLTGRPAVESWPAATRLAAIAGGTRRVLLEAGFPEVIAPVAGADSEALLAVPALGALAGTRILLVRGEGGRRLLADTLLARGAAVEHAVCYRRVRPAADAGSLLADWTAGGIDAVTVSSAEGLRNFAAMIGETGRRLLARTALFVPHARVEAPARDLGLAMVMRAGPSDEEMVASLVAYFANREYSPPST